jgi:hypothetical protein
VLVGSDELTVYRFDDPLGPGVPIHEATGLFVRELGAVPGAVHVLPQDVYVDVVTGAVTTTTDGAPLPPRNIVYVDERRAVARFPMSRAIFVTEDGGRTWSTDPAGLPNRVGDDDEGLMLEAAQRLFGAGPNAPPDVRWVADTLVDPLYAAVIGGVPLRSGTMLVARHERIARVDPRTGAVLEVIVGPGGCEVGNAPEGPFALCRPSPGDGTVHVVRLDPLSLGPAAGAGGTSQLVATPAGGLAWERGCVDPRMSGHLCIRQPDGSWETIQARRPRPDGSGIAWSFGAEAAIEVVTRDGTRRLLATLPDDRAVVDVSEDEEGRVWVLAGRGGRHNQGNWRSAPREWFVGELVGSSLEWAPLEEELGAPERTEHAPPRCGLMGRRTVCAVDGGVHVREGRGAPRFLHVETGGGAQPTQLGFRTGVAAHLGFEQGESPRERREEPGLESWPALACRTTGPFVPAASPEWEEPAQEQERWNGADGSSVRIRSGYSIADHFVRGDVEGVGVDLHHGFGITRVEASGFSVVWPSTWSAVRTRIAADRPSGPLAVGELERADELGLRPLLSGRRCTPGDAGDHLAFRAFVGVSIDGQPQDTSMDTMLHVVDGPSGACLARLVGTSDERQIRFDARTGRADLSRRDVEPGTRPLRCTLRS